MKNQYLRNPFFWTFVILFFSMTKISNAQSLTYKSRVVPVVNGAQFTHIAIGDIVGPSGIRTQNSMNLSDNLTTQLMAKGSHDILDRNVLAQLAKSGSPTSSIIDEDIISSIGSQYQSAVLIVGRIQSESIHQQLEKVPQSIVVNGCNTEYYYKSSGDFTLQLRILDAKTAKLIHAQAIAIPMAYETKRKCEVPEKLDENEIIRKSIDKMTEQVINTLFEHDMITTLSFRRPLLANPFKDLANAAANIEAGNSQKGLDILAAHTTSTTIKEKFKEVAYFNYAIGLLATGQCQSALDNFTIAFEMNPTDPTYVSMVDFTKKEIERLELNL
jgi:hypothetical protein